MKPENLEVVEPPPASRTASSASASGRKQRPAAVFGNSDWHGKTEQECYTWFVDAFRMRVEDEYVLGGGNLYGVYADGAGDFAPRRYGSCAARDFAWFLKAAHARRALPDRWLDGGAAKHDAACTAYAAGHITFAVEKSDMQEAHGPFGPMSLRALAERITGASVMEGGGMGHSSDEDEEDTDDYDEWDEEEEEEEEHR